MNSTKLLLLQTELDLMDKATEYLRYSYQRCQAIENKETYTHDELEHFESLTGRFARLSDLLTDVTHSISRQRATIKDCPYKPSCRGNPRSRKISM
jgi:hypothetical protein